MKKIIALFVALACAGPVAAQENELKFATFVSREHRIDKALIVPIEEAFANLPAGHSKLVVYAANSLVAGPVAQYPKVVEGVSDFTFALPGYTSKLFPHELMFELPGIYTDPVSATEDIWDNIEFIERDFKDVKIIALWGFDPTVLITRDKPVTNISDIRGMKVRITSPAHARIIKAWGATPVTISTPKTYAALESGEVDAVFISGSALQGFRLHEPANFVTVNLPASVGTMYIVMNRDKYESLPQVERDVIDSLSGREVSLKAAKIYEAAWPAAIKVARDNGVQIVELTPFQIKAFEERFPYAKIPSVN